MNYSIQILQKEIQRVQESKDWTEDALKRETGKAQRDLLRKYLLQYDVEIQDLDAAIKVLLKNDSSQTVLPKI